jgi:hypothetical protein
VRRTIAPGRGAALLAPAGGLTNEKSPGETRGSFCFLLPIPYAGRSHFSSSAGFCL